MNGTLIFADGSQFAGTSFGAAISRPGEVVFATGMVGYPEAITDPSFAGQILVLTYPLIGNYGVPDKRYWESGKIQIAGLIVSSYIDTPSHHSSVTTLSQWLTEENIPALEVKDTRFLAKKIRTSGDTLGKIVFDQDVDFYDPNTDNFVAQVSTKKVSVATPPSGKNHNGKGATIVLIDCGAKRNITTCLVNLGVTVITVPWDYDIFSLPHKFDGVIISNGPGDPTKADKTIETVKKIMERQIPILGICLGNQILTLAAGGTTKKMKFGHRSQNQPCSLIGTDRCYLTTQNHGFVVDTVPKGFKPWFVNINDGTNEGIIHNSLPFMSVQFHPEACPGPSDTEWIFTHFLNTLNKK